MIDIFCLKNEIEFFKDLAELKISEDKFRDVVFIQSLFPEILDNLDSLKSKGYNTN
jgi:hypothetical protein